MNHPPFPLGSPSFKQTGFLAVLGRVLPGPSPAFLQSHALDRRSLGVDALEAPSASEWLQALLAALDPELAGQRAVRYVLPLDVVRIVVLRYLSATSDFPTRLSAHSGERPRALGPLFLPLLGAVPSHVPTANTWLQGFRGTPF